MVILQNSKKWVKKGHFWAVFGIFRFLTPKRGHFRRESPYIRARKRGQNRREFRAGPLESAIFDIFPLKKNSVFEILKKNENPIFGGVKKNWSKIQKNVKNRQKLVIFQGLKKRPEKVSKKGQKMDIFRVKNEIL